MEILNKNVRPFEGARNESCPPVPQRLKTPYEERRQGLEEIK